ncbi:hypothetical protein [Streptomyces sp. NPDC088752]|uniref:hypothetical protein n=1 Tax=Streptomyces sp. NPDC088752 TaxID=3154963 RepID=UPI00342222C9
MSTATDTANTAARKTLRAAVREALDAHRTGTLDADMAEETIMDAAQQWVTTGYVINARPAAPCPGSGATVSRWMEFNGWDVTDTFGADSGPYQEGETETCRECGTDVSVTHKATTERETGTQYVGTLAAH